MLCTISCKNFLRRGRVTTELVGGGMTARQQAIFKLDELAAYLKVGKRTLYRLASHGEIPAFKVGGTWRFRQSET